MVLFGTIVNVVAIILGGSLGLLFHKGFPSKYIKAVTEVIGFVVIALGISYVLKSEQVLVLIISVICGVLIGTKINIESKLNHVGDFFQQKIKIGGSTFSQGFTSASLLFCVGAMAITGSIAGGLQEDHSILLVKSVMDGVIAMFFASTLGAGVIFSALSVLLYQGAITLGATGLAAFLKPDLVTEMSGVGGVALMSLGVSMIGFKRTKPANLLPGIFLPILVQPCIVWIMSIMG